MMKNTILCLLLIPWLLSAAIIEVSPSLEANLNSSNNGLFNGFGRSVAIQGDTALIGAPGQLNDSGQACVFIRSDQNWNLDSCLTITSGDSSSISQFGRSVSLSNQYAVVSAIRNDSGKLGVAFIFKRENGQWTQVSELRDFDVVANLQFATSVSITDEHVILGAQGTAHDGAVHIYKNTDQGWAFDVTLTADSDIKSKRFGSVVSLYDNYLIIGDYEHGRAKEGSVTIYFCDDGTWVKQAKFSGGNLTKSGHYGHSVSVNNEFAVVGADIENDAHNKKIKKSGAVYVYQRSLNQWSLHSKLTADDKEKHDNFGSSVSIMNNYILIGAQGDNNNAGSAYLFQYVGGNWAQVFKFSLADQYNNDFYSSSTSLTDEYALIGAYNRSSSLPTSGSAYLYRLNESSTPTQSESDLTDLLQLLEESPTLNSEAEIDSDNDGISDIVELTILGTNPNEIDSDGDGLTDQEETILYQSDPLLIDSDGDGLSDLSEVIYHNSDPLSADSDNDGYLDGFEVNVIHTEPALADSDGDGLSDQHEINASNTSPSLADTDGDGLSDNEEINIFQTDPLVIDSDSDGYPDGNEVNTFETDPLDNTSAPQSTTVSNSYSPSQSENGTMAFEDEWPRKGDYDFNDAVFNYNVQEVKHNGLVKQIIFKVLPTARGAVYDNSLRLLLNTPVSNIESANIKSKGVTLPLEAAADGNHTLFVIVSDIKVALPPPKGSKMSNTLSGSKKVMGSLHTVTINLITPVSPSVLGTPPYNSFLSRQLNTGEYIEVHFPGHKPSRRASIRKFGTLEDDTDNSSDKYYLTDDNMPWAMLIPTPWHHTKERVDLSNGYPDILNWASSKGKKNKNWYKSKRHGKFVFEDVSDL